MSGRLASICLAAIMLTGAAHAAEPPAAVDKASLIPVSQTEQMVNGTQTLTRIFEVGPEVDPDALREESITQSGYNYTLVSFTRESISREDSKTVTQERTVPVAGGDEAAALANALTTLPQEIDCEEEGYEGKLTLVASSIQVSETGRTAKKGSDSVTKTYTFEYNDDSLVPATIKDAKGRTLNRVRLTWAEGSYGPDGTIPENYVATAVYSRSYTYSTVDGYQATAQYAGEVALIERDAVRYTAQYAGTPIPVETEAPGVLESMFGPARVNPDGTISGGHGGSWALFFLALAAGGGFGGYKLYGLVKSRRDAAPVDEGASLDADPDEGMD